jgi:hypothetical protein
MRALPIPMAAEIATTPMYKNPVRTTAPRPAETAAAAGAATVAAEGATSDAASGGSLGTEDVSNSLTVLIPPRRQKPPDLEGISTRTLASSVRDVTSGVAPRW